MRAEDTKTRCYGSNDLWRITTADGGLLRIMVRAETQKGMQFLEEKNKEGAWLRIGYQNDVVWLIINFIIKLISRYLISNIFVKKLL